MIKILYFARLREQLGTEREEVAPAAEVTTVGDIATWLRARGGPWCDALGVDQGVMAAVNQEVARPDTAVHDGDEVAFFPPVTGG
ncbi:MAG: molybdopterin converting factor subunit 1 [Chromatiaceae bacterium]